MSGGLRGGLGCVRGELVDMLEGVSRLIRRCEKVG